jgi:hypothetical protein
MLSWRITLTGPMAADYTALWCFRFYFFSHDCSEARHTHVDREGMSAKFWLDPNVSLADNHGFSRRELRDLERITRDHVETLRDEWDAFCN